MDYSLQNVCLVQAKSGVKMVSVSDIVKELMAVAHKGAGGAMIETCCLNQLPFENRSHCRGPAQLDLVCLSTRMAGWFVMAPCVVNMAASLPNLAWIIVACDMATVTTACEIEAFVFWTLESNLNYLAQTVISRQSLLDLNGKTVAVNNLDAVIIRDGGIIDDHQAIYLRTMAFGPCCESRVGSITSNTESYNQCLEAIQKRDVNTIKQNLSNKILQLLYNNHPSLLMDVMNTTK